MLYYYLSISLADGPLVFPGGFLPTVSLLVNTMASGSKGRLVAESVDNIGPHYARTLREWRRRFEDRFDAEIKTGAHRWAARTLGDRPMNDHVLSFTESIP